MLTFFRRIRKSLLDGGATRKYLLYALGEILLVIIGILIALQINNLNHELKEVKTLISDLMNAQIYILDEIEKEENLKQKLIAWSDTIQNSLRIIEEVDSPSPMEIKYLSRAGAHLLKVGLRSGDVSSLDYLSGGISKSKAESRHELVKVLGQLMNEIREDDYLENSFYEDLLARNRSIDRTIWRRNSKGELFYDFELMKTDYDLQSFFKASVNYKNISSLFSSRIIEKYGIVHSQIKELLNELE